MPPTPVGGLQVGEKTRKIRAQREESGGKNQGNIVSELHTLTPRKRHLHHLRHGFKCHSKKATKGPSIKRNQTQFKENIYYVQVSRLDAVCLRWLEGNEGPAVGMRSKLMETCPHLITTQQHKGRAVTHVEGIEGPGDKPAPELTGCPRRLLPRAYEVRDRKDAGPQNHSSPQSLPNPDSTRGLWGLASFKEHHAFEIQPCHSRINASFPYMLESWSPAMVQIHHTVFVPSPVFPVWGCHGHHHCQHSFTSLCVDVCFISLASYLGVALLGHRANLTF